MTTTIRANNPNGNTATALIQKVDDYIEVEVRTSEGDLVLVAQTDRCTIRALNPQQDYAGDVGIYLNDQHLTTWVSTVTIDIPALDGSVEVRTNGLSIEEDA